MKREARYLIPLIFFLGCRIDRGIVKPSGYEISNSKRFKLKDKFMLNDTSTLSITQPYTLTCQKDMKSFNFYRNGRVSYTEILGFADNIKVTRRYAGYCSINNNELTIEMSAEVSLGMISGVECGIVVIKGEIFGDTLKFRKDQWYGKGKNLGEFTNVGLNNTACYFLKSDKSSPAIIPDW